MNMYAVGNQTLIDAFEVIGIAGRVIGPDDDVAELLRDLAERDGAELVLVESGLAKRLSFEFLDELARQRNCLAVEVPPVNGPAPDPSEFRQALQRVMGASL